MELRKTEDGQSFIIEVEKKKSSNVNIFARSTSILLGIGLFIVAVLLSITVIGLLLGIPLLIVSIAFIAAGLGYQQIKCPNCNRKQTVRKGSGNFLCGKCKKNTLIDWK